jgi:hypothetical protein
VKAYALSETQKIVTALFLTVHVNLRSLIFRPRLPPSQMVQARWLQFGTARYKNCTQAKSMQIAVDLQEGFLINVPRILGPLHQVQCETQHVAIKPTHQFLKGQTLPACASMTRDRSSSSGKDVTVARRLLFRRTCRVIGQSQRPLGKWRSLSIRIRPLSVE